MFTKLLLVVVIVSALVTACAPAEATDIFEVGIEPEHRTNFNEVVKNELQPILRAIIGGNVTDGLVLLEYKSIPCANSDGLGGPPRCPEGVAEGTMVEVFPMLGSEGSFATPEEMEGILTNLFVKNLHGVYRVSPGANDDINFPIGEYAMLFERFINDYPVPVILRVMDGKIVRMDLYTGISAAALLKNIPVEQIVITPQEALTWTEMK